MKGFKDLVRAQHTEAEFSGDQCWQAALSPPSLHFHFSTHFPYQHQSLGYHRAPPSSSTFCAAEDRMGGCSPQRNNLKDKHRKKVKVELVAIRVKCCPMQLLSLPWVLMSEWVSRCCCCRMKSLCCLHACDFGSSRSPREVLCAVQLLKSKRNARSKSPPAPPPPKVLKVLGRIWNKGSKCTGVRMSTERQKVRKSVSGAGRGGEGKCKDLTGNQSINLLRV